MNFVETESHNQTIQYVLYAETHIHTQRKNIFYNHRESSIAMSVLFHIQLQQGFELTYEHKALYSPQLPSGRDKQVSRAPLAPMMNPYRIHFPICLPARSDLLPSQTLFPPSSGLVLPAKF